MDIIIKILFSVWCASTIFMLACWFNAFMTRLREGKIFIIPFGRFFMLHFFPIVHTIQCVKIMKRAAEYAKREV